MKCPNNCGDLIELEKPALVAPTEDAVDLMEQSPLFIDDPEPKKERRLYIAIYRVCPKCGFHEESAITEQEFATK